jgi:Carboxypeptidase regulatory-like domain
VKLSAKLASLCVISFCVLAILAPHSLAQSFSASIAGVVTDPSGSVVQGAKVHLRNMGTNDTREATSSAAGTYKFDNLLPGSYEITAEASGFKAFVQSNMLLSASTAATVNVRLAVGTAEQKVEVTSQAVLLDTESANNSTTLDSRLIESLPNSYRNPLNFVFALAGTTEAQSGQTSRSNSFDQMGSMFGLNGGRIGNEQILIDGAPSTAVDWGGLFVAPNSDAVQEQQVAPNVYDAQYERAGAGVTTLVTKSGSNTFHGSIYDYFRNSALDANLWSNGLTNPVTPKGLFHRNQFGGTLGGPVSRSHHVFFFADYEGLRQPDIESSGFLTVPTQKMHNGDFSELLPATQIYNPFTTAQVCCDAQGNPYFSRQPFPNNQIESNLWDAVGKKILALYPLPNQPGLTNNYYKQGRGTTDNDKFDWRIDWAQSSKNRIFARMSDRVRQNYTPACFFCNGGDNNATNDDRGFQVVVNDAYTPSPTWVVDSYLAVGHWHEEQTSIGYGQSNPGTIGLSQSLFQAPLLPLVNVTNYDTLGSTYSSYDRYVRSNGTAIGNITKEFAKHTLKFGANYDIVFMNNRQDVPGTFNFGTSFTSCDPDPKGGPCHALNTDSNITGNAIASLLLGTGSGSSQIEMDPAMSLHSFGAYIQDQWRANTRLTITAGLRYENQRPATERYNRLAYFDKKAVNPISAALGSDVYGQFEYANKNNRYAWYPDNLNFAPRLGVAYKITDKLVSRVGAGIFYAPASAMISFDQPGQFLGYSSDTNWLGSVDGEGYIPTNLVSNPFPNGLEEPVGSAQGGMTFVGVASGNVQQWPKGPHPIGYSEQWSADLQYELGRHSVFEVGYTGTRGHRLMFGNPNLNANQLPTKDLALGSQLNQQVPNPFQGIITDPNSPLSGNTVLYNQLLRPYPEFVYLNWTRSLPGAQSAYDALNLKFTKQFSDGLSLISTYVWSKALDDGSEDFIGWTIGNMWRDSYHPKLDYAISTHDVPHSFATALVYDLPYGRGKRFGSGAPKLINGILGNWQVSSVIRLATGLPLLPPYFNNYDPLGAYGFPGPTLANLIGDPKPAQQSRNNWINAAAFAEPGPYLYGDEPARMTQLREGATKNLDLAVAKGFDITERFKAQFRAEFLNAFNHPQYGGEQYGEYYGSSNITNCLDCGYPFGQVIGTRNDPRNIQMSLKVTF